MVIDWALFQVMPLTTAEMLVEFAFPSNATFEPVVFVAV